MWWIASALAGTLVVEPGDLDPDLSLVVLPADAYELRAARASGLLVGYIPWGGGLVDSQSWVFGLEPSPFLRDIENELVKHQPMDGGRRKPPDRQLKLL